MGQTCIINIFFPFCHKYWDHLNPDIRDCKDKNGHPDLGKFKCFYLKSIRDRYGVSLLTQLRLGLSDHRSHRLNHGFKNCPCATCTCGIADETVDHYLTCCPRYNCQHATLMDSIVQIANIDLSKIEIVTLTKVLLYGSNDYNLALNKAILPATITFIKQSKRFKVLESFCHVFFINNPYFGFRLELFSILPISAPKVV